MSNECDRRGSIEDGSDEDATRPGERGARRHTRPDGGADDSHARPDGGADDSHVRPDGGTVEDRWLAERPVIEAPLPPDVADAMGELLGRPVETLGAFVEAVRDATGGDAIEVEQLCHADGETPHRAEMGGETYHFLCFYDAVVLARLAGEPVELWTESPSGEVVSARAEPGGDVAADPEEAVASFGVSPGSVTEGPPTAGELYGAVCPNVRAFPDRAAYERWAREVEAATVGFPLADGAAVAAGFAE